MVHSIFEPCVKNFQWRTGNNDGKWRVIAADDRLLVDNEKRNYIWEVRAEWEGEVPLEVYTGFTVSAKDYGDVWRMICADADLNGMDYDDTVWNIRLIGIDLTDEGDRIINVIYRGR